VAVARYFPELQFTLSTTGVRALIELVLGYLDYVAMDGGLMCLLKDFNFSPCGRREKVGLELNQSK
jgi:hypothetical protein